MKKLYSLVALLTISLIARSQGTLPTETVGNPTTTTPVSSYTGWSNQGTPTYVGTAVVSTINPSAPNANTNYTQPSGKGNILFNNTPGTYFQLSNFPSVSYQAININFGMYLDSINVNANPYELLIQASIDSGINWRTLQYNRNYGQWTGINTGLNIPDSTTPFFYVADASKLLIRFIQTSSVNSFRMDDIAVSLYMLLPIKLKNFTVNGTSAKTSLVWNAFSNSNKEIFIVEKSRDGVQFLPVNQVNAKGNGEYSYEYYDETNRNKTFYRLKMINTDGKGAYSKIIMVNYTLNRNQLVEAVYPVPAKDILHFQINNVTEKSIKFSIADVSGKIKLRKTLPLIEGINNLELNILNLEMGVYYLTAMTSENSQTEKIIVTK